MTSISKKVVSDRVTLFVQRVRSSDTSINLGFQPNNHWWISHPSDTIKKKHENAYSFLEQIGVSTEQMIASYGKYWLRDLESHFPSLQKRQFKNTNCITILSADTETTEMAPNDKNIVGGLFQETRSSKSPWNKLRDAICGETYSSTMTISTNKNKKFVKTLLQPFKVDQDPILQPLHVDQTPTVPNNFTNYWLSSESEKLFDRKSDEDSALASIENQITALINAIEKFDGYKKIVVPSSDESDLEEMLECMTQYQVFVLVNLERSGKRYKDSAALIRLRGTDEKKDLERSPFIRSLDYGANQGGYWTYDNTVEQFEDCQDVMKTLHSELITKWMFDQSSGHCKKKEDGLNVNAIKKGYGGKQRKMRDTIIKEVNGYLGDFPRSLNVGDSQHFTYDFRDIGPFYLSETERELKKFDQELSDKTTTKKRKREDLVRELNNKGIFIPASKVNNSKWITETCINNQISCKTVQRKMIEGWYGKEKGLLQICLERGLVDQQQAYKVEVLKSILGACNDFQQEESQLQFIASSLGVTVLFSPKCHPELAGEGIEYTWAELKNFYRRIPLRLRKKKKDEFFKEVEDLMSKITIDTVRKSAKKARQYICAYHEIHNGTNVMTAIPKERIEKLRKTSYKSHRTVSMSDIKD